MLLGLGTGSTVRHFLEALAARIGEGLKIVAVASSLRTEAEARRLGIPLTTLEQAPALDLCVDGADEVDGRLDCLKGLGGALVREKVLASVSRRFVLIIDGSKRVERLGTRAPVLVEVLAFAQAAVGHRLGDLRPRPFLREGKPFISDNGNPSLALATGPIEDPAALDRRLNDTPGIVDHGLFVGLAHAAYVASPSGVESISR